MGFDDHSLTEQSQVAQWLQKESLGGVILFDKDVSSGRLEKNLINTQQIQDLNRSLNYYSKKSTDVPLFIAIDYEGGKVDRLASITNNPPTLCAQQLALLSSEEFNKTCSMMADNLKKLGFNLNFAPVIDLLLNEKEGIIGGMQRSFSANPEIVISLAQQFIKVFGTKGIACCYKHFPGHGSAIGDTHKGFVDVSESFQTIELVPYYQLIKNADLPVMIMTAHVINKQLDEHALPATLSHNILTGLLREKMGYKDVIVSDDLQMHAIATYYSLENSLELTINAGADMIIIANQLDYINAFDVISIIERLILAKKISLERIDESYARILKLKKQILD